MPTNPFLNGKELEILSAFFPGLESKTLKEIEAKSPLSHEPTFRLAKSLTEKKYLKERKIGKTNIYDFIRTDETYLIYHYYNSKRIYNLKHKYNLLYKRIKEFITEINPFCAILFGSYAKGTEQKNSDVDLLIITKKTDIEEKAATYKTQYNITLRPIKINPLDFKNIKKDNPEFYKDLVDFGIVIKGTESFYKEVYET